MKCRILERKRQAFKQICNTNDVPLGNVLNVYQTTGIINWKFVNKKRILIKMALNMAIDI